MSPQDAPRLGHDLVAVPRFAAALARRGEAFRARVFTDAEWDAAAARPDRDAVLAARFAAKEAAMKALGTGWGQGVAWREVEVLGGGRTPPTLALHGRAAELARALGIGTLRVSLSHTDEIASAVVLAVEGAR